MASNIGRTLSVIALGCAATPWRAVAQAPVVVEGQAYDSLRGQPLKDALVTVLGSRGSATTDERGRFRLDSVPPGTRTFLLQHASLDSIGFTGISRKLTITSARHDLRITVPSFQTLWRAACGRDPQSDSGFVHGTIRDVRDLGPVADARVEVSWVITTYNKARGVKQQRVIGDTRTDAHGNYALCGVPARHWLSMSSSTATASAHVDLPPAELRVQRRDLLIGPELTQDSASHGTIVGMLTDQDGVPFSEARVVLDDSVETRSAGDGRFSFRRVRAGTRQVEVMSIGMMPIVMTVDVAPADSAAVTIALRRVTTLDVVQVTASRRGREIARGIEERRRNSFGYSMDMTELQAHHSFATVFNDFPGARVRRTGSDYMLFVSDGRGGECNPEVWIDGARSAMTVLYMTQPKDVMAVEFFPRASTVPVEFRRNEDLMRCGAVLVWTNWAFSR